ncbi:hypothetical protein [Pontibacter burrus]|uniref:Uncharacterized protein n=1 Tax=Pontibacter burrus TaxID=2704466 RepID=A0A6B3LG62_9BACT|nr:hypothetical protein [Pontibacter burrus]NEM96062.1 hypothetical protein [Pontibacter burrus]
MNKISILLLTLIVFLNTSCAEKTRLASPDKAETITVIRKGAILYIINGSKNAVPDTNYVKLRMISVDLGSEIAICWQPEHLEWDLVADGTEILINKLDTTKYKFRTGFPLDGRGIPTPVRYYSGANCGSFSTYSGKVFRNKGIIVE